MEDRAPSTTLAFRLIAIAVVIIVAVALIRFLIDLWA